MKKKGFTLIELLAVIVILAVIALIAIPIITNVIEKAKVGSAESSVVGYVDAVEKLIITNEVNTSKESIKDGMYLVSELEVDIKGSKPIKGYVTIDNKSVVEATICMNNYSINYINGKAKSIGKCSNEDKYKEAILNGTDPVLKNNLIPVEINDDGKVKKADIKSNWYNYYLKKWANAVILKDESIIYNNNDEIPEENIESYFVWIPRYRYKLWYTDTTNMIGTIDESKKHSIEIVFENKDVKPSTGSNNGEYLTHPAFTTFDTNGFWVGKFETGYEGATIKEQAQETSSDSTKIIVKPNVYSWRNNTVYNMFLSSYNYKRDLDSHMMKNTEWGAVAYLSHSKFGINKEININNNNLYKTGYSALPSTNQQTYPGTYGDGATYNQAYNTSIGYLASTTGNITGVYDMSGGAHEYMSSYMRGQLGVSGFDSNSITNYSSKYFDVYNASSSANSYQYRILGDATGEMGPFKSYLDGDNNSRWHNSWYADSSTFVISSDPWFHRGGHYGDGVLAGQFYFHRYTGGVYTTLGSRLVLTDN